MTFDRARGRNGSTGTGGLKARALCVACSLIVLCVAIRGGSVRVASAGSGPDGRDVALPEVSKAVRGGTYGVPYNAMPYELRKRFEYTEAEYFVSGEAASYRPQGSLAADGAWSVEAGSSAPYTTRVLVRRPSSPARFNGTFLVEWLNVTGGKDLDADFGYVHPLLLQRGYGYIGVTAQRAGVHAGGAALEVPGIPPVTLLPLKEWDPERYAPLDHPGDDFSYDIFQQAARGGIEASGLRAERTIAIGESQSASRLATYVNAIQPIAGLFDGFVLQARGPEAAPLESANAGAMPNTLRVRTDVDVPVLQIVSEAELEQFGFVAARQPDAPMIRTWEVAGTAHADQTAVEYIDASTHVWYEGPPLDIEDLCGPVNDGPLAEAMRAGLASFDGWIAGDGGPPEAQPIEIASSGVIVRDQYGNAQGGVRLPAVEAPTLALSGKGGAANPVCSLFGSRAPLSSEQLAALYADHDAYVDAVREAGRTAVRGKFLLRNDARRLVKEAQRADVP
jgi:hypothetical protein